MLPHHLIHCCSLLLLPSIFPSIRVFSNELALCIRWPKYWSFSNIPSNEYSGLISCPRDFQESCPAPQFKSINSSMLSLFYDILGHAKEIKFLFLTIDFGIHPYSVSSLLPSLLPSLSPSFSHSLSFPEQGSANLFYDDPDRPCRPDSLCHNYSVLPLQRDKQP